MATVIESLLVELGLDTKQFNAEQKKAVKSLKDFEDQATKTNKATEKSALDVSEAFGKIGKSLLALTGISLGLGAFREFVADMTTGNAQLGRQANLLGKSARELDTWGRVAKTVGGDAKDVTNFFTAFQQNMAAIKLGGGNQDALKALALLSPDLAGESLQTGTINIYKLADAVKKFSETHGIAEAKNLADRIGVDNTTFQLLIKGKDQLQVLYDEMYKTTEATDEAAKAAQRLQESWAKLTAVGSGLASMLFTKLEPSLENVIKGATNALTPHPGDEKRTGGGLAGFASSFELFFSRLRGGSGSSEADSVVDFFMKKGWTEAQAVGIAANIQAESGFNSGAVGDQGRAYGLGQWHADRQKTFEDLFGHTIQRSSFNEQLQFYQWELMNSQRGAGGALTGATTAAQAASIISRLFERPADSEGEAARRSGLAEQMFSTYGASHPGAGSSVKVDIGKIEVNTQATSADSIAKSIGLAIQEHAFMGAGMVGMN